MALQWIEGFELFASSGFDTCFGLKYPNNSLSDADSIAGDNLQRGVAAWHHNGVEGTGTSYFKTPSLPAATSWTVALCVRFNSLGNIEHPLVDALNTAVPIVQLSLVVNTSGYLEIRQGGITGTTLDTSSQPLKVDRWQHIQWMFEVEIASGRWVWYYLKLYINNHIVLDDSGLGRIGSANVPDSQDTNAFKFYASADQGTGFYYQRTDDIYIKDDWDQWGILFVEGINPSGSGAHTDWGVVGQSENWAAVVGGDASDSDYVYAADSGMIDTYAFTDIDLNGTIRGIQASIIAKATPGLSYHLQHIKPMVYEGGSTYEEGVWVTIDNSDYQHFYSIQVTSGVGDAWTQDLINNDEFGYQLYFVS